MPPEYVFAIGRLPDVALGQAVETTDQLEVLPPGEDLVDRRRLTGEAHTASDVVRLGQDVEAGHPARSARRHAERRQHPHEGGLAGTVGSEQAEDRALGDDEADAVDGAGLPEVLDQVDGLDRRCGAHAAILRAGTDSSAVVLRCGVMRPGCELKSA
jgi:hypothetical protein